MALAGCAAERHEEPIKAQRDRWAWAGVKCGAPEGSTDFMALSRQPEHAPRVVGIRFADFRRGGAAQFGERVHDFDQESRFVAPGAGISRMVRGTR